MVMTEVHSHRRAHTHPPYNKHGYLQDMVFSNQSVQYLAPGNTLPVVGTWTFMPLYFIIPLQQLVLKLLLLAGFSSLTFMSVTHSGDGNPHKIEVRMRFNNKMKQTVMTRCRALAQV